MSTLDGLIDQHDTPQRQNEKLRKICAALIRRVEQATEDGGAAYAQFQRAVLLEDQVQSRTRDLEQSLELLNRTNARLAQANLATEAARSDLANAIESIQEGFALFSPDDVLIRCNSRFGMHMPDLDRWLKPGLRFDTYVEKVSQSPHLSLPPDETPALWAQRRRARHGDAHVVFNVELSQDRWLQVSELRTDAGQTIIMQTDITEIMRLERLERSKMLDQHARLIRATLDHINQGVCIFDTHERLLGWNQRVAELLSMRLPQFHIGADFNFLYRRLRDDLKIQSGATAQEVIDWVKSPGPRHPLRFEVRDRSARVLDVFAQEMPDMGFVISFSDVTAERLAAQKLQAVNDRLEQHVQARTRELAAALASAERANASKTRFVAAASHDLLQPLSAAKLYVSSIAEEPLAPQQIETLRKTQNALDSVEEIIGALLDIGQLESGNAPVNIGPVDLGKLMRHLIDDLSPLAARKGLELRYVATAHMVQSDHSYLRRILQNLIGNAIRYTQTGRILVGARRCGAALRLEVWDTGPGIPEDQQENIYKEFHRLDGRDSASASQGLGLGLAIVERACALLDHPHGMRSRLGKGTGFFVTVPLTPRSPAGAARGDTDIARYDLGEAGLLVLVVENDQELRRALCLLLEQWGVQVLDVRSGREAVELLREVDLKPDAILVDYQLGQGETGLGVIDDILTRFGQIPARIITASRAPEVSAHCEAANIAMMLKPIDPTELRFFLAAASLR